MSVGDAQAIADWFNGSRYTKEEFLEKVFTKYTFTIHGAALEDISISHSRFPDQVITVTLDSTGEATTNIYGEIGNVLTLDASLTGYHTTYTLTAATTDDIYCMPESALYWYGNTCDDLSGGYEAIGTKSWSGSNAYPPSVTYNSNNVYIEQIMQTSWQNRDGMWKTKNNVDVSGYTKLNYILDTDCYTYGTSTGMNACLDLSIDHEVNPTSITTTQRIAIAADGNPRQKTLVDYHGSYILSAAILALDDVYVGFRAAVNTGYSKSTIRAVWLE